MAKKVVKKKGAEAASDAAGPATKPRAKTTNTDPNKQPGFAEQEEALKPKASGKKEKPQDAEFKVLEMRLLDGGMAEADVVCSYFGDSPYKPIGTNKVTLQFKQEKDDFDSGGNLWDAFEAGNHLRGQGFSETKRDEDLLPKLIMAGAMALRDEGICKNLRDPNKVIAEVAAPQPQGPQKLTYGGTHMATQIRYLGDGRAEVDLSLALIVNGRPDPARLYTVNFKLSKKGDYKSAKDAYAAFVKAGHLAEFEYEDDALGGPIAFSVITAIKDAFDDPYRQRKLG